MRFCLIMNGWHPSPFSSVVGLSMFFTFLQKHLSWAKYRSLLLRGPRELYWFCSQLNIFLYLHYMVVNIKKWKNCQILDWQETVKRVKVSWKDMDSIKQIDAAAYTYEFSLVLLETWFWVCCLLSMYLYTIILCFSLRMFNWKGIVWYLFCPLFSLSTCLCNFFDKCWCYLLSFVMI